MEERTTNKSQQIAGFEEDVNLEDELQDRVQESHEITWTGRPAITLIRHWKCPHCEGYDTLNLNQTLMTNPMQYQYECSNCHKTFITREAITSIVYVDAEFYDKEKEASGTGLVEGRLEYC